MTIGQINLLTMRKYGRHFFLLRDPKFQNLVEKRLLYVFQIILFSLPIIRNCNSKSFESVKVIILISGDENYLELVRCALERMLFLL